MDEFLDFWYFNDNERGGLYFLYLRVFVGNFRGWGDRCFVVYVRDIEDWRERGNRIKVIREIGFFSCKSFVEVGCSEDMMKVLKENNFD